MKEKTAAKYFEPPPEQLGLRGDPSGERPEKGKTIFIERYNTGGMSGGFVSCDFWPEKGFSLLIQRYIEEVEH